MIVIKTEKPRALFAAMKKAIEDRDIKTWAFDSRGYLYHTPEQWQGARLKVYITPNEALKFAIVTGEKGKIGRELYAIYHGRFIEMMLAHFDDQFTVGRATALPAGADLA